MVGPADQLARGGLQMSSSCGRSAAAPSRGGGRAERIVGHDPPSVSSSGRGRATGVIPLCAGCSSSVDSVGVLRDSFSESRSSSSAAQVRGAAAPLVDHVVDPAEARRRRRDIREGSALFERFQRRSMFPPLLQNWIFLPTLPKVIVLEHCLHPVGRFLCHHLWILFWTLEHLYVWFSVCFVWPANSIGVSLAIH